MRVIRNIIQNNTMNLSQNMNSRLKNAAFCSYETAKKS